MSGGEEQAPAIGVLTATSAADARQPALDDIPPHSAVVTVPGVGYA